MNVGLPGGLRFTRSHATVGVTGVGGRRLRFTVSLQHGTLVLKLRRTSSQLHVTISYPRLQAGGGLVAHHSARLTLTMRATDTLTRITRLIGRVKPNS